MCACVRVCVFVCVRACVRVNLPYQERGTVAANDIGSDGVRALADALGSCALVSLDLRVNAIEDAGAESFAAGFLSHPPSLPPSLSPSLVSLSPPPHFLFLSLSLFLSCG